MKNKFWKQFLCAAIFASLIVASDFAYADETLKEDIVPSAMINHDGVAYFADSKTSGLWKSDGTSSGTILLKEDLKPKKIHASNKGVFFHEEDKVGLWFSDGSSDGTIMVNGTVTVSDEEMIGLGDNLLFTVKNDDGTYDLWVSDATVSGTKLLKAAIRRSTSDTDNLIYNDKLYFQAKNSSDSTYELWVTNGTAAGTIQLKNALASTDRPSYLTAFNEKIYFSMSGGLWMTDGSTAGTTEVKADAKPTYTLVFNKKLYFSGRTTDTGTTLHLMVSDGTDAGTVILKSDIVARELTAVGNAFFFVRRDIDNSKYQLWKSDGTAGGTVQVKDDIEPKIMKNFHDKLYFLIYNEDVKYDLWVSDGTEDGTEQVWQYVDTDSLTEMSGNGAAFIARKKSSADASDVGLVWTSGTSETTTLLTKDDNLVFDIVELNYGLLISESVVMTGSNQTSSTRRSYTISKLNYSKRYNLDVESGQGGGKFPAGVTFEIIGDEEIEDKPFLGWGGNDYDILLFPDSRITKGLMPARHASVIACAEKFTLTVLHGEGSGSYIPYRYQEISANVPAGQTFFKWELISGGADVNDSQLAKTKACIYFQDSTVDATFKDSGYKLTVVNGTIVGGGQTGTYAPGQSIEIISHATLEGKIFTHWTGDTSSLQTSIYTENNSVLMPEGDIEITATLINGDETFELKVVGGSGSGTYKYNSEVEISATLAESEEFVKWTGLNAAFITSRNSLEDSKLTMKVICDLTVTAVVKERDEFILTVLNGDGSGTYAPGTEVEIEYTAGDQDYFKEWQGYEVSSPNSYKTSLIMPKKDLTVTGVGQVAKLIIVLDPPEYGTCDPTPGSYDVFIGESVTINVTVNEGYGFAFWSAESNSSEEVKKPEFSVPLSITTLKIWGDTTFTAKLASKEVAWEITELFLLKNKGKYDRIRIKCMLLDEKESRKATEFNLEKVSLTIGAYTFNCDSENGVWKTKGDEEEGFVYIYNSNKDSEYGKIKLKLDYQKQIMQFDAVKTNIPIGDLGNMSEIGIALTVGDNIYSSIEEANQNSSWQFNGKKDEEPTDLKSRAGNKFEEFTFEHAKIKGRCDTLKTKRNFVKISKGKIKLPDGVAFDPTKVSVSIDEFEITFPELEKKRNKEIYSYKGEIETGEFVKVSFDLEKKNCWFLNIKNCDGSKIDPDDGIDCILKIGDCSGGKHFQVKQKGKATLKPDTEE